jgi:hypothetical protein
MQRLCNSLLVNRSSSNDEESKAEDALPSFKELVASYFFITDQVTIETDK